MKRIEFWDHELDRLNGVWVFYENKYNPGHTITVDAFQYPSYNKAIIEARRQYMSILRKRTNELRARNYKLIESNGYD